MIITFLGQEGGCEYWRYGADVRYCQGRGPLRHYCVFVLWERSHAWRRMYGDLQERRPAPIPQADALDALRHNSHTLTTSAEWQALTNAPLSVAPPKGGEAG